jgi:predicted nucleic acid-binding protein
LIVLDASALVEFLVGTDATAASVLALTRNTPVAVPHLIDLECASALRGLARGQRLLADEGERALRLLARLPLRRYDHTPFLPRVWALRHVLGPCDASYVALAEALGADLVTLDGKIAKTPGLRCTVRDPRAAP